MFLPVVLPPPIPPNSNSPFVQLRVYAGAWSVQARHPFSDGTRFHTLENQCAEGVAFYTCEQIVNGKPVVLVIFTPTAEAGKFDVDSITPNGHASSDTDLFIQGDRWTYITNDAPHHPVFKVENTFHGREAIHFEMFETKDGGKTWNKTNEGDDSRIQG